MSSTGDESADRLRVGGWVLRKDALLDDETNLDVPQEAAGEGLPDEPSGEPEPQPASAGSERGPIEPGRGGGRSGIRAKALAGAAAVVAILVVLAVTAYQSMTRAPAAGPAGYGAEPSASRIGGAVPPTDPSALPTSSRSARPATTPLRPPVPGSPAPPSPAGRTTAPGEVLANGGFESGTLAGWSCAGNRGRVVSSPVHSGRYALAGDPSGGRTAQCAQTVSVQPRKRYTVSAWVSGENVYLGVTGDGMTDPEVWTAAAPSYTELHITFVVPPDTTSVTVYVHGWYAPGSYYADDISMT